MMIRGRNRGMEEVEILARVGGWSWNLLPRFDGLPDQPSSCFFIMEILQ